MFRIGDFSKLSQVSIRMLRHYHDIGLLSPAHIDEFTSYRYYGVEQLSRINNIQALKDMGFSLSAIKDILDTYNSADSLRTYLQNQQNRLEEEARVMAAQLLLLKNTLKRIGDAPYLNHRVSIKEIPQRYVASLRKVIPSYNDEHLLWEQMRHETAAQRLQMANPSYGLTIFHDEGYKESNVDVEIQVSVDGAYRDTENVRFTTVKPITAASSIMKGRYEQLTPVNEAIATWVAGNQYRLSGAMFCIYHVSPGHNLHPENWVMEICYPVA